MTLPVMPFRPAPDPYTYVPGFGVVSSDVEFGPSRVRRDFINPVSKAQVMWQLNKSQYDTFMLIFRTSLMSGSLPFTMPLITDSGEPLPCTCRFIPDTIRLGSATGDYRPVSAELEVLGSPLTIELFEEFTELFEEFGNEWSYHFGLFDVDLDRIINVNFPEYLP